MRRSSFLAVTLLIGVGLSPAAHSQDKAPPAEGPPADETPPPGLVSSPFWGDRVRRKHTKGKTPRPVAAALRFLQRRQHEDGWWDDGDGTERHRPGLTGLAMLCFLAEGSSHAHGEHKDVLETGLRYLLSVLDEKGRFVGGHQRHLYDQAIATLALAETYIQSGDDQLIPKLQAAVAYLAKQSMKYGPYGYVTDPHPTGELPLTAWAVHALVVARSAGVEADGWRSAARALEDAMPTDGSKERYVSYGRGWRFRESLESEPQLVHGAVLASRKRYVAMALGALLIHPATNVRREAWVHQAASLLALPVPTIEEDLRKRAQEAVAEAKRCAEEDRKRGGDAFYREKADEAELRVMILKDAITPFHTAPAGRLLAGDEHYAYWASLASWQLGREVLACLDEVRRAQPAAAPADRVGRRPWRVPAQLRLQHGPGLRDCAAMSVPPDAVPLPLGARIFDEASPTEEAQEEEVAPPVVSAVRAVGVDVDVAEGLDRRAALKTLDDLRVSRRFPTGVAVGDAELLRVLREFSELVHVGGQVDLPFRVVLDEVHAASDGQKRGGLVGVLLECPRGVAIGRFLYAGPRAVRPDDRERQEHHRGRNARERGGPVPDRGEAGCEQERAERQQEQEEPGIQVEGRQEPHGHQRHDDQETSGA